MSAGSGRSWTSKPTVVVPAGQVGRDSLESHWPKFSARELLLRRSGRTYDFVNEFGVNVVVDSYVQNIRYPAHNTVEVVYDNLGFRRTIFQRWQAPRKLVPLPSWFVDRQCLVVRRSCYESDAATGDACGL